MSGKDKIKQRWEQYYHLYAAYIFLWSVAEGIKVNMFVNVLNMIGFVDVRCN